MNKIIRGVLMLLFASLSLIGCSGSDGGGAANFTGKFVDATVEGLGYKCGPSTVLSGSTTATGEFTCPAGQAVAFYVGDIQIGSVRLLLTLVETQRMRLARQCRTSLRAD